MARKVTDEADLKDVFKVRHYRAESESPYARNQLNSEANEANLDEADRLLPISPDGKESNKTEQNTANKAAAIFK